MANDMFATVVEMTSKQIEQANVHATNVANATVDTKSLVHEIRDTDPTVTDEKVLNWRKFLEAANAEILAKSAAVEEHIKATLLPAANGNIDVEAEKAAYKELKATISAARKFVTVLPGYDEKIWESAPELKTLRGGTSSSTGTGGKRPRIERIWVGDMNGDNLVRVYDTEEKDGETREINNFTLAAKFIGNREHANTKVQVSDLQQAAFDAAGTNDLNGHGVFSFVFSPDEGKHSYTVKVQPKDLDAVVETAATPAAEVAAN